MKKIAIIALSLLMGNIAFSQKLMTRTGEAKFDATGESIEEIVGTNSSASCILDQSNGELVALVLIKSFKFKSPLMEEHFNENYMESTKFPKANFKGKVLNYDAKKVTGTKTAYDVEGDLTIHGVTKKIKTKIYLSSAAGKVSATSDFKIKLSDYGIDIPSLVKEKFAKEVKIALKLSLEGK